MSYLNICCFVGGGGGEWDFGPHTAGMIVTVKPKAIYATSLKR